jgi:hypothetical protein
VKTPFEDLDKMLGGGFSAGRCVGLVGCRGGHKSHLGYRHVLEQLIKDQKQRALVVSLRDDEQVGLSTMEGILRNELGKSTEELNQLIRDDRLDMMYFPPGYITPDEFFHRVCLGIQRLKLQRRSDGSAPALTLLFNSLDQLGSRFPLCAREEIFVPGLIEMLNAEGVTSVFIGVQESGQPEQQYGLLSMADIIISADRVPGREYTVEKSDEELKKSRDDASAIANLLKESGDVVLLEVKRVAGGRAAGRAGVLHLDEQRGEKGGILRFASVRRRSAPV